MHEPCITGRGRVVACFLANHVRLEYSVLGTVNVEEHANLKGSESNTLSDSSTVSVKLRRHCLAKRVNGETKDQPINAANTSNFVTGSV